MATTKKQTAKTTVSNKNVENLKKMVNETTVPAPKNPVIPKKTEPAPEIKIRTINDLNEKELRFYKRTGIMPK